jgi:hypothetical protein
VLPGGAVGGWGWGGLAGVARVAVRFPASEVRFDFFLILLFLLGFLAVICFASVSFLFSSFLLMHHSSIFSSFHLFMFSYFKNPSRLHVVR